MTGDDHDDETTPFPDREGDEYDAHDPPDYGYVRRTAEDLRQRSAEIRREAERIRSLSMITLLNVEINYRTAHKAYRSVMRDAHEDEDD